MNMEAQATATPKSEGEEKQAAFETNAARAAEIQKEIASAAATGDFAKIGELSAEGAQLKSANETVVAEDHQEGMEMNAEFDAEKARQEAEAAKAAAEEAAAEQARFVQEAAEKAATDQVAAEKLAAEIKSGGKPEEYLYKDEKGEWTKEKPQPVKVEANSERVQEILDWARTESDKSRVRAAEARGKGMTDVSSETDILLNERTQLVSKMNSGYPLLTDAEKAVIQSRVEEIDANPEVTERVQDQANEEKGFRIGG